LFLMVVPNLVSCPLNTRYFGDRTLAQNRPGRMAFLEQASILPGNNGIDPGTIRRRDGNRVSQRLIQSSFPGPRAAFGAADEIAIKRFDPVHQATIFCWQSDWSKDLANGLEKERNKAESFHPVFL
jgi:hypothetical protein